MRKQLQMDYVRAIKSDGLILLITEIHLQQVVRQFI